MKFLKITLEIQKISTNFDYISFCILTLISLLGILDLFSKIALFVNLIRINGVEVGAILPYRKFRTCSCMIWVIMKAVAGMYDRNAMNIEHTFRNDLLPLP